MTERYALDDHLGERTQLVAAAYVALLRGEGAQREVLLHLRAGTGYMDGHWATLAGHVDPGEAVDRAAVREVEEESGVQVRLADLEPLTTLHRVEIGGPAVEQRADFFFVVRRWEGEPHITEPDKCAAMTWVALCDLDELDQPVVPHERLVLESLRRGETQAIMALTTRR